MSFLQPLKLLAGQPDSLIWPVEVCIPSGCTKELEVNVKLVGKACLRPISKCDVRCSLVPFYRARLADIPSEMGGGASWSTCRPPPYFLRGYEEKREGRDRVYHTSPSPKTAHLGRMKEGGNTHFDWRGCAGERDEANGRKSTLICVTAQFEQ